jgi:hypothetical protein
VAQDRTPRRRRRVLWLCLAAVVGVWLGWVVFESAKVWFADPNPAVDSRERLRALAERTAGVTRAEGEAAWKLFTQILDGAQSVREEINALYAQGVFEQRDEHDRDLSWWRVRLGPTLPDDLVPERRAAALMKELGVLKAWAQYAAGPPGLHPRRRTGLLWDQKLGYLSQCRDLAQAGASLMRLAAANGNGVAVVAAFEQQLALARTCAVQGDLLSYLTASAIEGMALEEMRLEFMEEELDEATCLSILTTLERHRFPPLAGTLEGVRIEVEDLVQWSYTDDGSGNGYMIGSVVYTGGPETVIRNGPFAAAAARFIRPTRREFMESYEAYMDRLIEIAKSSFAERPKAIATLDRDMASGRANRVVMDLAGEYQTGLPRSETRNTLQREGTRLIAALELFRARTGRYPESLDELAPAVLAAAPRDPLNDLPYGYRLLADDPDGRPYLLYSVGLDGRDDGGVEVEEEHGWGAAITKPELSGVDFVLNRISIDRR